jgi:DNA repair protein RadD
VPPQTLRGYQDETLRRIALAFKEGARSVLCTMPTGSGKTTLYSEFARRLKSPGLVLVHRRELATQGANRLREFGVSFGYILAGKPPNPAGRVQIATLPSLRSRGLHPPARFVICDEAHLSTADTWRSTLAEYPDALILGCTATPWRLGGKPLSSQYDKVVVGATPRELRELGFLCGFSGFSYKTPDLSKLRKTAGDYNERDADEAMRQPAIVTNIVEKWQAHASTLSTVLFAVTIEHSKQLCAEFKAAGVRAEHIDGETPRLMREAILKRVESGETQVLCNVGIAIEGIDIPRLKCCILARPTMSLTLYLQMVGRVMRPWEGATARIHDHAFLIRQHGLPDQDRDYSLHAKPEKPPALTQCESCFALYSGPSCPACGHENMPQIVGDRQIVTIPDAEAFDFASGGSPVKPPPPKPEDLSPVIPRWDKAGKAIEGVYQGFEWGKGDYGPRKIHKFKGRRIYHLQGYAMLNQLLERVAVGLKTRVTFTGLQASEGNRWKHLFKVEVDRD